LKEQGKKEGEKGYKPKRNFERKEEGSTKKVAKERKISKLQHQANYSTRTVDHWREELPSFLE
jgi:hypothetical protein